MKIDFQYFQDIKQLPYIVMYKLILCVGQYFVKHKFLNFLIRLELQPEKIIILTGYNTRSILFK